MSPLLLFLLSAVTPATPLPRSPRTPRALPPSPLMRSAPLRCPIDSHNTLDVRLFVADEEDCFNLCKNTEQCQYYRYYSPHPSLQSRSSPSPLSSSLMMPTQCYLFRSCGRNVESAPPDCQLNQENTIQVVPFVHSNNKCMNICQQDPDCGYFKYYPSSSSSSLSAATSSILASLNASVGADAVFSVGNGDGGANPDGRSSSSSLMESSSDSRAGFCYVLRSCAKRMVDNVECTLGRNNFLDIKMFVPRLESCREHCVQTDGCRYYQWYPIGRSDRPRYCYLFRQCAAKDEEPEVAFVIGGRHPGHYYLSSGEHNDFVMRSSVCMVSSDFDVGSNALALPRDDPSDEATLLARAGAVAAHVGRGRVLFCGGRGAPLDAIAGIDGDGEGVAVEAEVHDDCLAYDAGGDGRWSWHSRMNDARDEASSALLPDGRLFALGGIGLDSSEVLQTDAADPRWEEGPTLPQVVARACAVAVNQSHIFLIGGHDGSSSASLSSAFSLDTSTGEWSGLPPMSTPRRDHACLHVEFEASRGVLVTGGLGPSDEILDSAEFLDLDQMRWTRTSSLKRGRTEHAMSLVYGIPTVIGGLSNDEFLSSIEQFDKSSASWNVPLQRDWRTINTVLSTPRYEMAVASIPVSDVKVCDSDVL